MDLFEMAATYVRAICTNHPFLDGNKRTAAASALVFLYLNGFELEEEYDEGLADQALALMTHKSEIFSVGTCARFKTGGSYRI